MNTKKESSFCQTPYIFGGYLLSPFVSKLVPSALKSLTSVFEMGTGVSSFLLPPYILLLSKPSIYSKRYFQSNFRVISIGQLNTLLHLHLRPIYHIFFMVSFGNLILRLASYLDAFSTYQSQT